VTSVSETLHATAIAIGGRAVLIEGASGAGKSDLALRLIDRGAMLIADDRTIVTASESGLAATCPATIAGRIEARGIGIVSMPNLEEAPVSLIVNLSERVERMPEPTTRKIAGVAVRSITLDPREASAPIKVEIALRQAGISPTVPRGDPAKLSPDAGEGLPQAT